MNKLLSFPNKVSLFVILIYTIIILTYRDSYRPYNNSNRLISFDMQGYYSYLQAYFIYDDLKFNFIQDSILSVKVPVKDSEGNKVYINKYSSGPAILCSPFFLLGHLEAYWQQVPRDGRSYTYLFWVATGVIFYIILSLFLLRSVLLRYYSDTVVASVLASIALGTNLLYYVIFDFLMSHVYSFFLFSTGLYLAVNWHEKHKNATFFLLSFVCGLIAVTRLPNMLFFLVLAFWGVHNKESFLSRLDALKTHKNALFIGFLVFLLPFIPQVTYWYSITGRFYVNPYSENYEYIYWGQPMISEVLIGFRKGWLIYTPVMIFGFLGFIPLYKKHKEIFVVSFLFAILNIYVVSCWSTWWYGGSFGMRALVEGSIVFLFPMASFFTYLSEKIIASHISVVIISFFIFLNMFQTHQYTHGIIHYSGMTRQAYWVVFGVMPPVHSSFWAERDKYIKDGTGEEARREVYVQTIW